MTQEHAQTDEAIPINIDLTKELGSEGLLGTVVNVDDSVIEEDGFFAETPDQPFGFSLRRIFSEFDPNLVAEIENEKSKLHYLYRRFDLWLVPHGVSIVRRTGRSEPISVGVEVKYKVETGRTCSVRALIP